MFKYITVIMGLFLALNTTARESRFNIKVDERDIVRIESADKAAIPRMVNFQGFLTDAVEDTALTGDYDMEFKIYDVESKGNLLWSETQSSISVAGGIFNVILGEVNIIPDSVFTDFTNLYLELTVAGEVLSPRQQIVSVGRAYKAAYADTADYAYAADVPYVDSAGVAAYAHEAGHAVHADTAQWTFGGGGVAYADTAGYAHTLQDKDTTAFAPSGHNHIGEKWEANAGTYVLSKKIDVNSSSPVYAEVDTALNSGSGTVYGGLFYTSGSGSGSKYGVFARGDAPASPSSNIYGIGSYVDNLSSGGAYGANFYAGGSGTGNKYGVVSSAYAPGASTNPVYGVYSNGNNFGSGGSYGGYFKATTNGTGPHYGVYAESDSFGIYAKSTSGTGNYAGYFEGNVKVASNITSDEYYKSVTTADSALMTKKYIDDQVAAADDGDWTISGDNMYSAVPGSVGVGVISPTEKLDVDGAVNVSSFYRIGGDRVLSNAGTNNIFVGVGAGENNTIGNRNTFSGNRAGSSNTTGNRNTFSGYSAGHSNTIGNENTFSGTYAGYFNTTGNENTFSGYYAGRSNTIGHSNTFSGNYAGYSNTEGDSSVFVGYEAGYNETGSNKLYIANGQNDANVLIYGEFDTRRVGIGTTSPQEALDVNGAVNTSSFYKIGGDKVLSNAGTNNIFVGVGVGENNTTGTNNTFLGDSAGYSNITGYRNTFSGYYAGYNNTIGHSNTFSGNSAGYSNTTGYCNTFTGYYAGSSNTTGNYNTFTGYYAGYFNTSGNYNTFSGNYAGFLNTTGDCNTFTGYYAGRSNTAGNYNTFSGYRAGYNNTTGNYNTFSGYQAGYNTTGSCNTFSGNEAGYQNTTGHNNTFSGYYVGYNNTEGYENTFSGNYAGHSNTTGNRNTFSGYNAGYSNTAGAYNVFIGYCAGYDNTTDSSKLYIANGATDANVLIYGEFDNRYLGIGRADASYPLHMGSGAYCSAAGVWTDASSREYKENITELEIEEAVEVVNKLKAVRFNYKVDKEDEYVGFIAEDVPELVATKDRTGLSPMDIVAVLTKVVQGQQNEIEALKAEIEEIKHRGH